MLCTKQKFFVSLFYVKSCFSNRTCRLDSPLKNSHHEMAPTSPFSWKKICNLKKNLCDKDIMH